jgi:hypothetical protein
VAPTRATVTQASTWEMISDTSGTANTAGEHLVGFVHGPCDQEEIHAGVAVEHGRFELRRPLQHAFESLLGAPHSQGLGHRGPPQIQLHQRDPPAARHGGHGQGEVAGRGGLAVLGHGAGDEHGSRAQALELTAHPQCELSELHTESSALVDEDRTLRPGARLRIRDVYGGFVTAHRSIDRWTERGRRRSLVWRSAQLPAPRQRAADPGRGAAGSCDSLPRARAEALR